jgi:hypothetical protein
MREPLNTYIAEQRWKAADDGRVPRPGTKAEAAPRHDHEVVPAPAEPAADDRLLIPGPNARRMLGGIGWTKFCELMNEGEIERVNIGRRSFVTAESLRAYVERLRQPSAKREAAQGG